MTIDHILSERERLHELRTSLEGAVEAAEQALETLLMLKPILDWLEEISAHLEEHEDLLRSEDDDDPLDAEEARELVTWASGFSECMDEGSDIVDECIPDNLPQEVMATLEHLLAHFLSPIRQAARDLYDASIRAV